MIPFIAQNCIAQAFSGSIIRLGKLRWSLIPIPKSTNFELVASGTVPAKAGSCKGACEIKMRFKINNPEELSITDENTPLNDILEQFEFIKLGDNDMDTLSFDGIYYHLTEENE